MAMPKCKECKADFVKNSENLGAIYTESSANALHIDYFVCRECLDENKHFHTLNLRGGWSHLYGDISSNQWEWMDWVCSKTSDTVCGKAGYVALNPQ
jgi:hypothetical protein